MVISPLGYKARVGSALFAFVEANIMYIPRDPPLVLHLPTLWWPTSFAVVDPETSERGGQETWNISRRTWWPSFFGLFLQARGGTAPLAPPGSVLFCHPYLLSSFLQSIIRHSFETVDTDKTGSIDRQEFETWYEMQCTKPDTIEVSRSISRSIFNSFKISGSSYDRWWTKYSCAEGGGRGW